MGIVRFFIVSISWLFLAYTPKSLNPNPPAPNAFDFFRCTMIFTLAMTYDYWSMMERSKPKRYTRSWWMFRILITYSLVWFIISFLGLFNMAEIVGGQKIVLLTNTYFQEIDFISVRTMLLLMLGFPILSIFERALDNSSALDLNHELSLPKVESA